MSDHQNDPVPRASPDPVQEELARRVALAELEAKLAEARAELLQHSFPESDAKAREGSISIENVGIPATMGAYAQVRRVADAIAKRIGPGDQEIIVAFGESPILDLAEFRAFREEVGLLETMWGSVQPLERGEPEAEMAAVGVLGLQLSAATLAVRGALDVLSFVRTDLGLEGTDVTIPHEMLAIAVADALRANDRAVRLPQLGGQIGGDAGVARMLEGLATARIQALASEDPAREPRLKAILTLHDAFEARLLEADPTTKRTRLTSILSGAGLETALEGGAELLRVWIAASGGAVRTRRGFLRSSIAHFGGVAAGYLLIDRASGVRLGDLVTRHSGYLETPREVG